VDKRLKPDEVAELLGVEKCTIYQWTHQGFIPHVKLGNRVRFRPNAIEKWITDMSTNGRRSRKFDVGPLSS